MDEPTFQEWRGLAEAARKRHRLRGLWAQLIRWTPRVKHLWCARDVGQLYQLKVVAGDAWTFEERMAADGILARLPYPLQVREHRFSPEFLAERRGDPPWLARPDCGRCPACLEFKRGTETK